MKEVYLIRHGATAGNLERRYIGRTDEPLCPEGRAQIERLRQRGLRAETVFVSPMLRARQSAELLFPGRELVPAEGLRETDFGVFEGRTAAEMEQDAAYRRWVDSGCLAPIPGGEDVAAFKDRVCTAFASAMQTASAGHGAAAFVIHGGGIMAILERFARPAGDFYSWHIGNGAAVACVFSEGILTGAHRL